MISVLEHIKRAAAAIERETPFEDAAHYYLSAPGGGGYATRLTLEEAVERALDETSATCDYWRPALILSNTATQDIALFYDGRAFLPAELLKLESTGERNSHP